MDCGLAALEWLKKIPIDFQWEKSCDHSSAFTFDWNFFVLAENEDMHTSFDELEFQPYLRTDYQLPALEGLKNQYIMLLTL